MGDPLTSLEGGAGVGSRLGNDYKWPPPSARLQRGPLEARSAPDRHVSRLSPGGGGGGGSEPAPGRERSGQDSGLRGLPDKWLSPRLEPQRGRSGRGAGVRGRRRRRATRPARAAGQSPARSAGTGEQATSRSPWSAAGTPASCCARCSAVCFSQVRRGRGGDREAGALPRAGDTRGDDPRREPGHGPHCARLGSRRLSPPRGGQGARLGEQLEEPAGIAARMAPRRPLGADAPCRARGSGSVALRDLPDPQTCSQAAGPRGHPESGASAPGDRAEARRWRCWALATTSRLEREGGEPTWRGLRACRDQTDSGRWEELVSFNPLRAPKPDRPRTVPQASAPLARPGPRGWRALRAATRVGPLPPSSPGRRRGQSRTQIPLSFGIASL